MFNKITTIIIGFGLFKYIGQFIANRYQQQLINLSDVMEEKKPFTKQESCKVILLHSHILLRQQSSIFALVWKFLPYVVYSAPFDGDVAL